MLVSSSMPQFLTSADGMLKDSFQSPQIMSFRANDSFRRIENSLFYSPLSGYVIPQCGGDNVNTKQEP